ncbi:SDR family NAD(P)-dependent oxidoreductase [Halopenitus persicus]|uniref:SDR family NAD(P)-dependent oxidoreductase n=1 Tax=Halopenitus persicus TaxID=1048396 RepID=UPI0012FDAC99|nr:glucose 1-dehydrogenase [Halopenitus persicus]
MKLANRTAIVTGAASGIGRAIAIEFAKNGADVAVADVRKEPKSTTEKTTTVEEIESHGQRGVFVETDVSDSDDTANLTEEVVERFGGIDVFVNNAGISVEGKIHNTSPEDWNKVQDINVNGIYNCMRTAIPYLQQSDAGRIINIASQRGMRGGSVDAKAAYSSSKGAIIQLTRQMAIDYGPDGITVNAICPGPIDTSMNDMDEVGEFIFDQITLPYVGQPEDIGNAALFLASDEAKYITGHTLVVDGGYLVGTER